MEADGRLVQSLIKEVELAENSNAVETPGVAEVVAEEEQFMSEKEATLYRRGAAKVNDLSLGRPDLGYAFKELSRSMARPRVGYLMKLKRVARYLVAIPRWISRFEFQGPTTMVVALCDRDWGGCVQIRKPTTGGVILQGSHAILHWSRTQQSISLSSAEAALSASIKAR